MEYIKLIVILDTKKNNLCIDRYSTELFDYDTFCFDFTR